MLGEEVEAEELWVRVEDLLPLIPLLHYNIPLLNHLLIVFIEYNLIVLLCLLLTNNIYQCHNLVKPYANKFKATHFHQWLYLPMFLNMLGQWWSLHLKRLFAKYWYLENWVFGRYLLHLLLMAFILICLAYNH